MEYTLDLPRHWVYVYYPETDKWENVANTDYPSMRELAGYIKAHPKATQICWVHPTQGKVKAPVEIVLEEAEKEIARLKKN